MRLFLWFLILLYITDGKVNKRKCICDYSRLYSKFGDIFSVFLCSDVPIHLQPPLSRCPPPQGPVFTNKIIQVNKVRPSPIIPVYPNSWLFKTTFSSTLILMQKFWQHCPGSVGLRIEEQKLLNSLKWCPTELGLYFGSDIYWSLTLVNSLNFSKLYPPIKCG